ncbi:Esterase EstB [Orchesella cincta]|uniref:Esterase EstB n=1 Tax=Orchesella cincta TaxID=48709 RepID=A0A1D2N8H7_ORCCI|nr:Esterase EstB [Orchesella cincta]
MARIILQILSFCVLGLLLSLPQLSVSQNQNIDPAIQGKIHDFIQNVYLPATKTSTLGLSIVKNDGEVLYSTGYGYADQEIFIPNGNQTQFLIGSTTKSFTSVIVIKVLSEKFPDLGEKVLDTPIKKLIPSANLIYSKR